MEAGFHQRHRGIRSSAGAAEARKRPNVWDVPSPVVDEPGGEISVPLPLERVQVREELYLTRVRLIE
jgi:hypothetical protein